MYRSKKLRRKLDNAALAFPAATGKKDSRVFRIYCKLREPVDPKKLQEAVDKVIVRYPLFQSVLKRGNFWYYFEETGLRPKVRSERRAPCGEIYDPNLEKLLYEVTYQEYTVNLEIFHALTDGTGAIYFLSDIVCQYLQLAHNLDPAPSRDYGSRREQSEDSFSQYYSRKKMPRRIHKSRFAYQITGRRVRQSDMRITECLLSVKQLLEKTRSYQVSITEYMTAVFMEAIYQNMDPKKMKRPVCIMIPINLRNYFPSKSMANFFGWMEIEYQFHENVSFPEILDHVKKRFAQDLVKEQVAVRMTHYVKIEKNPLLGYVPLKIKNLFLRVGTWMGGHKVTSVFSNMSIVKLPERYHPYIRRFGAFASTDKLQICACSFYDKFYFSMTSKFPGDQIQQSFLKILEREGISVTNLPPQREQPF